MHQQGFAVSNRPTKILLGALHGTLLLGLCVLFAWLIGLTDWGRWHSTTRIYRLQLDALLNGHLSLQPVPYGQLADWAWGLGSQQPWGLGVPLLRLPFEAVARSMGALGFPDRIHLLLFFAMVSVFVGRSFADLPTWERTALTLLLVAAPAFITTCRTRLAVYEEAIAYACLWQVLTATLLLRFARMPTRRRLWCLCVVAGLGPLFRPTLVIDAIVTMTIGVSLAWQTLRRPLVLGLVLFAFSAAMTPLTNLQRFGSALETGHRLNSSGLPEDQFAKLFDSPYLHESLAAAVVELVSAMTAEDSFNGYEFFREQVLRGQSPKLRFRELYFTTFHTSTLVLLLLAWGVVGIACVRCAVPLDARIRAAGLWSAATFALLFLLYLWTPALASRYLVDLAPAVSMGIAALLLLLFHRLAAHGPTIANLAASLALSLVTVAWVGWDVARARIHPSHGPAALISESEARSMRLEPVLSGEPLPKSYRCGDDPSNSGIQLNGIGWESTGDCSVRAATTLFFDAPVQCLRLHVATQDGRAVTAAQTAWVRAKVGLVELVRRRDHPVGKGRVLEICVPHGYAANPYGFEIIYLGWLDPASLHQGARPLRLLSIGKVG